jgi:hypothetical protein
MIDTMTNDQSTSAAEMSANESGDEKAPSSGHAAAETKASPGQMSPEQPMLEDQADRAEQPRRQPSAAPAQWAVIVAGAAAGAVISLIIQGAAILFLRENDTAKAVEARVARLESSIAGLRAVPEGISSTRLSTIEANLNAVTDKLATVVQRNDDAVATSTEARKRVDTTAGELAELRKRAADGVARNEGLEAELRSFSSRVSAIETAEKAITAELAKRTQAQNRDRSGRFAVVATALWIAVEQGKPFAGELAVAKALAPDPKHLGTLEPFAVSGVPTSASLARELASLMPTLYAAAGTRSREGSFLEKLEANAEKLVHIRRTDEAAGSDPGAVLGRIEIRAVKGDLAGSLTELEGLPPDTRAPAAEWMKKVQERSAALAASRRLADEALAELSK